MKKPGSCHRGLYSIVRAGFVFPNSQIFRSQLMNNSLHGNPAWLFTKLIYYYRVTTILNIGAGNALVACRTFYYSQFKNFKPQLHAGKRMQESSLPALQNARKPAMERLLSKIRPLKPRSRFEENKLADFLQSQAKSSPSTKSLLASRVQRQIETAENRNSVSQWSSPEQSPILGSTRPEFENTPSSRTTSTALLDEQEREKDDSSGLKVSGSELISSSTELGGAIAISTKWRRYRQRTKNR